MNKINVAIADDNQRTVEMMTELLEQESDIEVIASADNGEDALRIIKERQPDVVLLDIIMPKLDGIGVLEHLQRENLSKRCQADRRMDPQIVRRWRRHRGILFYFETFRFTHDHKTDQTGKNKARGA